MICFLTFLGISLAILAETSATYIHFDVLQCIFIGFFLLYIASNSKIRYRYRYCRKAQIEVSSMQFCSWLQLNEHGRQFREAFALQPLGRTTMIPISKNQSVSRKVDAPGLLTEPQVLLGLMLLFLWLTNWIK